MSRTRIAAPGSPLRQERWASSIAHIQGLKANLVARRCQVVNDPSVRELIWYVQWRSHQPGGLVALAGDVLRHEPGAFDQRSMGVEWLTTLCLDPCDEDHPTFRRAIRSCMEENSGLNAVVTAVGKSVHSALDYSLEQRCLVVVEGLARIGKTFAAKDWARSRAGRVRYVQCPSTNDDVAFFVAVAKGIGLTVDNNPKTKSLRPRIEDTLQSGDLMLVIDEAHYCWPGHSYRNARPSRICWLLTALVNHDVPVALVVTPQFFKSQEACETKIGWACEQLTGRIGDYLKLPDELGMEDLRAVARNHLPEGDTTSIEALALYAGSSQKYLAAIEHAVKKARYLAGQAGRETVIQADIRTAIESGIVPSDSALAGALRKPTPSAPTRERSANTPPPRRENIARRSRGGLGRRGEDFVSRGQTPLLATD